MVDRTPSNAQEGHKRSKSALALSILSRDKSKSKDSDYPASPAAESPIASANSPTISIPRDSSAEALFTPSSVGKTPSITDKNMSIEQSVKTFRLFEILRSGDTTAISKAIRDSRDDPGSLGGTTVLHLAIQCAEPQVVEFVLTTEGVDLNAQDKEGNTPIFIAAQLGRAQIVRQLLDQPGVNDSLTNYAGQTPLDAARTPDIFQQLQLSRSLFIDDTMKEINTLVAQGNYDKLEDLLVDSRVQSTVDVNSPEIPTDPITVQTGGTLLHEATRKKDIRLIQVLLMHGADPFRRDRKGKLPQDVTKDDKTRAIVKKSPAAAVAQRGIQEKAILGSSGRVPGLDPSSTLAGKETREMKGYLKKWTNYTSGYKLRWFVLEDGVLSYYKHQDDSGSACRGAINMRIARLHMDAQDKTRFEIHGKSSVKYHLKANHVVEAKRWFWSLNNAIQWTKDEAKEEERRKTQDAELLRQARAEQVGRRSMDMLSEVNSLQSGRPESKAAAPATSLAVPGLNGNSSRLSLQSSRPAESAYGEDESAYGSYEPSRIMSNTGNMGGPGPATTVDGDEYDNDVADDGSSRDVQPASKDAFNITAQSVKLQLDLLSQVADAMESERNKNPTLPVSDPVVSQAYSTYRSAVGSLTSLIGDLLKISRDRDAYWQYRLDREADTRKMWEESMARVAQEHEELQNKIGESEDKRKRTKKALREALEGASMAQSQATTAAGASSVEQSEFADASETAEGDKVADQKTRQKSSSFSGLKKSQTLADLSDSDQDDDDEFFDAVDAGEVELLSAPPVIKEPEAEAEVSQAGDEQGEVEKADDPRSLKHTEIVPSFRGYEDPVRNKLKMDADDRPKISLWGILKSMIGKDMTKMTLPVSFNEPTSLLQRVAEDMEYADLLDIAADRLESSERMVYVAAFAASEYASTIGRVAKPFNPLLGETYEYVRPDKGYRFYIEQVSHHPPIGAAYADSARWDYYGESAVKSKFYGKSFDINPLGTWFLRLRPANGPEELYTWKKVTSTVVGIITGNPTVDNYGPMEVKNHMTGETCLMEFKARGWKASSAFHVSGRVMDKTGTPKWSMGGRWNDKIYARHTPGFEGSVDDKQAFLVWQCHERPTGIPFNLTPFVLTLNAVPDTLRPHLPPTDTRLRPDQRAMEDGEYDFAATEKNRVEEKQRAARRVREQRGEEFKPKWFTKGKCEVTGEEYWIPNGAYWQKRSEQDWSACEDIF